MKYFLVILALVVTMFGGKMQSRASENYDRMQNGAVSSENARIYSPEDQLFPARYFYPTYPEYVDYRYQNGYNGQLVKASVEPPISSWASAWTKMIPITSFALLYGAKAGIFIFSVLFLLILGVVLTTTICTFTPICTITFPFLALTKNQIKEQVAELARNYITPESLNAATVIVQEAVDKYTKLKPEEKEKETVTKWTSTTQSQTSTSQLPISSVRLPVTTPQLPISTTESTSSNQSSVAT